MACIKLSHVQRNEDMPVKSRPASTLDVPKKVISPNTSYSAT